jgi:hypothetical protein
LLREEALLHCGDAVLVRHAGEVSLQTGDPLVNRRDPGKEFGGAPLRGWEDVFPQVEQLHLEARFGIEDERLVSHLGVRSPIARELAVDLGDYGAIDRFGPKQVEDLGVASLKRFVQDAGVADFVLVTSAVLHRRELVVKQEQRERAGSEGTQLVLLRLLFGKAPGKLLR